MTNDRSYRGGLLGLLLLPLLAGFATGQDASQLDDTVYTSTRKSPGVTVFATSQVHGDYLDLAVEVYRHMTSRSEPYDLRALHTESDFKILLITEGERFSDLPEYQGQGTEIDQAGGLGGCIGEFFIGVRVGSPHALVHEIGHGIYHSAIQFQETGGARDEDAWYRQRVRAVHGMSLEAAFEELGEEEIHEVLLAEEGTFSGRLAAAWRNADKKGLWRDEYAGTEPNEYWAEGVALWFGAYSDREGDTRSFLREQDRPLYDLCSSLFPSSEWSPAKAVEVVGATVAFEDLPDDDPRAESPSSLIGGAVQRRPTHPVPTEVHTTSEVRRSGHAPFAKELSACGIVLVAEEAVADAFLVRVGRVISEIFPQSGDGIDGTKQTEVLTHLHAYGALLPVPRSERSLERLIRREEAAWDRLQEDHSVCDIIMSEVPDGQVMEVVEHVLHTVTDVGLHYAFPAEWGLSRESELWRAMQSAIQNGYYDVSSYEDLDDAPEDVRDRVLLQEFAYWFLTTAWDLQEPYGPNEAEWTLRTPAELREAMPKFFAIYEQTAHRVMRAPSLDSLMALGPTRADERKGK